MTMADTNDDGLPVVAASPFPRRKKPSSSSHAGREPSLPKNATDKSSEKEDLCSIHRRALQSLHQAYSESSKSEKLVQLRRKRIRIASQLCEIRQKRESGRTVGDELRERKRRADAFESRPYLHVWKSRPSDANGAELLVQEALEEQDLAVRMQQVRHFRKIAAAYRLAGISMSPCPDSENLALRFDIAVEGVFVACYHCFFELVVCGTATNDNDTSHDNVREDRLHLRLVQHTLPPSVPLGSILQKTMGGVACVGPLDNDRQWKSKEFMDRLRKCANEIYQACYCYSVRKQAVAFLKSLVDDGKEASRRPCMVQQLECTETLSKISFQLLSGISSLHVTLAYKDPMRVQPNVSAKNLAESSTSLSRNHRAYAVEISDDDAVVNDDLVDNAIVSFRRLPVRKAIQEVSDAMAEW
jgi:hypothetical protein